MAIRNDINMEYVEEFLNNLLQVDREFTNNLIMARFKCNDKLTCHPTIQNIMNHEMTGVYAGFLGVLNGMFGVDDEGATKGSGGIHVCVKKGEILTFATKDQKVDFGRKIEEM